MTTFKTVLDKINEYIPEFFIFTPIVLWALAFITGFNFLEDLFMRTYWWMAFGVVLSAFSITASKLKNFL